VYPTYSQEDHPSSSSPIEPLGLLIFVVCDVTCVLSELPISVNGKSPSTVDKVSSVPDDLRTSCVGCGFVSVALGAGIPDAESDVDVFSVEDDASGVRICSVVVGTGAEGTVECFSIGGVFC